MLVRGFVQSPKRMKVEYGASSSEDKRYSHEMRRPRRNPPRKVLETQPVLGKNNHRAEIRLKVEKLEEEDLREKCGNDDRIGSADNTSQSSSLADFAVDQQRRIAESVRCQLRVEKQMMDDSVDSEAGENCHDRKRITIKETIALIKFWALEDHQDQGQLWKKLEKMMGCLGYHRRASHWMRRFTSLLHNFKRATTKHNSPKPYWFNVLKHTLEELQQAEHDDKRFAKDNYGSKSFYNDCGEPKGSGAEKSETFTDHIDNEAQIQHEEIDNSIKSNIFLARGIDSEQPVDETMKIWEDVTIAERREEAGGIRMEVEKRNCGMMLEHSDVIANETMKICEDVTIEERREEAAGIRMEVVEERNCHMMMVGHSTLVDDVQNQSATDTNKAVPGSQMMKGIQIAMEEIRERQRAFQLKEAVKREAMSRIFQVRLIREKTIAQIAQDLDSKELETLQTLAAYLENATKKFTTMQDERDQGFAESILLLEQEERLVKEELVQISQQIQERSQTLNDLSNILRTELSSAPSRKV